MRSTLNARKSMVISSTHTSSTSAEKDCTDTTHNTEPQRDVSGQYGGCRGSSHRGSEWAWGQTGARCRYSQIKVYVTEYVYLSVYVPIYMYPHLDELQCVGAECLGDGALQRPRPRVLALTQHITSHRQLSLILTPLSPFG